jgi:hypothetical protein
MALVGFESGDVPLPTGEWVVSNQIGMELEAIRRGEKTDRFGWNIPI